nr:MAG TPA: PolyVal ADP-Ribosyltransferase [Caudoviricetes sp.]
MLSYDEVKNFGKKAGKKQSDREKLLKGSEPAKEAMYKKWQETKVAGGTVNPIISTDSGAKENENLAGRKATTYEESLTRNRKKAEKYNAAVPTNAKAAKNINQLIFGTPKEGGTINPTISAADFSTRFSKMTAREKAVYSHYKQAGKSKEAADYLKSIEMDVNKRAAEQRTADAKKLAEDSTMGGLYARYMGALTSPLATAYSLVQDAKGEAIDPNNPLFLGEQIRQGQTEGFLGESRGAKKWLKEAALGAFDWGSQVATLGALGLGGQALGAGSSAMYGASAFSGNAKDAAERGATTEEAVAYGTIGAAAEVITEKLGFERLFKLGKLAKVAGGKGKLAAEILKSMGSEGLEEGTSEAANQIADALIMGDRSQMAEIYMAAKAAGKTEGEATAAALKGAAGQIGYSAGVGALSGGMIAGGVAGGSRLAGRNVLGEGTTEAEQPLAEEEQTLQTEQNMPSAEQNMPAAEQTMPVTEQTAPVAEEQTTTQPMAEVQKMGQQTAEQSTAERTVFPEAQAAESYTKDLQEYSGKYYGAKGQEVYLRKAAETGNLDHTAAFNTYYRAGIAGIREDEIRQTAYTAAADKLLKNEAYMAGAEDRRAEIANAIRGTSKLTGKRGLIVGEDVKATEGQLAIAKLYADIGGAEIRLVDEISFEQDGKKHTANGYYEDGVITLALKSDSFMGTMNHEMIHYIRKANPAGYDAMRELVFKLANKSGVDMEKRMAEYEEEYGEVYGEDTRMADIMEEMVADGFQKIVENEAGLKEFLTELHRKDKTLFDKIREFLEKMGETIKALFEDNTYAEFAEDLSKDLENIKQLRKKFAEVLADTGRMEEGEGRAEQTSEAKFSLTGKTEDGMEVYETSEDIKKMPYAERMKLFVSLMENEYRGRTAKFSKNGKVYYARFANEDVKKNIWGDKQSDKEGWKAKINVGAEGNIFELVENADYTGSKEEAGKTTKAHAGVMMWDYYVKRVQINGKVYDLLANVREKQDGEYVYSIGLKRNKKITPAPPLASADNRNNGMAALQDGVNTDVINQSVAQEAAENNNRNVTKFSLRDSDGNKLSEGQKEYFKDSKAVDENGNLLVMYHGTKKGGFTTFRDWSYLTAEKKYAERYTDHNTKETIYKVYANMENPFDTRLPECREIFENEFFGNYSRTPLQETGLPDWTDGYDLAEFIEENEYDFDGILLDEGADADESGEILERGISYVIRSSEQIKNVDNTEPTKDRDIRFSIRKKDVDTKTAENENWKAAYEGLLREFEITKEPLRDREAAQKVVRKFLKEIKSGYDEEQFLDRFVSLCNYGADLKSDSDYKDLVTACAMLAEDALRESAEMDMELYDEYADLRKELRTSTLYVNKKTLNDLAAQDIRYNELRQANFGRVKLSQKDGESIDTKYAEWAERFPELFKADQNTSQSELLMDIIAVRKSLDPVVKNPYFEEIEEHAEACAYELLGMMNDVALEKQTFADKYEEKLRKLRQENKEALRRAKEQAKNEKQLLREKYATNAEARIAAVKEKYEKRMDRSEYWRLRRLAVKDAKALAEWMKSPTDSKHIPKKFKETVGVILGLIETEKPDLRIPLQSFVTMKGALQELYGDQEGIYLYVEQDDQVINILDRFIQKYPEGANLDTMNGADMKYFRNLIASVKKACTDANKLHTSQREKSVIEVSEGFIKKSKKKKDARETGIIRRMQDFLGLEMLDANSFFKRIGGDVYSELWKGLRKGLDKKINHWREAMDFINELVDPKTVRKWTEEAAKEFEIGGTKVQLTIPQIMSLYCLMKRDQGRQHIIGTQIPTENGILDIRGGGFKAEPISHTQKGKKAKIEKAKVVEPTAADIQAILGTLTEEQKKAAEAIQKYLSEDVAAWGNETTMLLFGYEKFTTKNYFPIVSDKNFVNQLVTKTDDIAPSLKSLGMTKNINRFANNPVMIQDIFKVFANHVDQMSNYNAFAASESDFNKFMNYKKKQEKGKEKGKVDTVRNEMDRTMGKGGAKYIKTLMNRLVTASGLSDDSDFAKMLVRNMKVASVGANLRVIVQQPTAYLRAGNSLSMKYLLNPAVFKKTDKETIYKYAPIALWKSWGNYEMDTGKTMYEQMIAPTKAARTKELLMAGAGWADEVTWSRLWNACVLEAKDKHKGATQEEIYTIAGERFGEIVDESQVVDSVLHRSQIMRKKGLYTQMTTSFMSEPTKTFNMASNALVELVRNNTPENRRKFVRCYMTIIASSVATACAAGLVDAMRDDDDDDTFLEKWKRAVAGDYSEAETPKDYIMAVLSNNIADNLNPMGMIPYLRDGWSLLQGYDINRTDFDWLNDIMKNIKRWEQFAAGESEYTLASLLLNTTGAISKMTGVPIGSAERDLKALTNWVVLHIIGDDEMKFNYKKLSKDVGSEKNASYYAERMLKAKFSGNDDLATRIYNEMIAAGVSNEKIDNKLESKEKKLLKEEPETTEGAEAYAAGDYSGYMNAIDSLTAKGYGKGYAVKVIESVYKKMKGGDDEGETFEPITNDYWDNEPDKDPAGYEMMFNAYMSGNINDYSRMWDRMEANGKEEGNIKSSMKSRLKKAYQAAKAEGDYQKAQRAKTEFLRLGGKPETLEG